MKITPQETGEIIKFAGITPEPGHVYNIYRCGHIYDNLDDPQKLDYEPGTQLRHRCCPHPNCKKDPVNNKISRLFIKYKKCTCRYEQASNRLQKSDKCRLCVNVKTDATLQKRIVKNIKPSEAWYYPGKETKAPMAALTFAQAKIKGVACIPLRKLFDFRGMVARGMI